MSGLAQVFWTVGTTQLRMQIACELSGNLSPEAFAKSGEICQSVEWNGI
jgi:hypothetical protein